MRILTIALTIVVLPVPGPPVIIVILLLTPEYIAFFCNSSYLILLSFSLFIFAPVENIDFTESTRIIY